MADEKQSRVVSNYAAQAAHAQAIMRDYFVQLKEEGWVRNEATGVWTHPLIPGTTIEAG